MTGAPVMDIVGGPQGSGKSSLLSVHGSGYDAFNIDEHRRRLNGGSSRNVPPAVRDQATRDYERFIESHIASRTSFSIEVTLARDITFEQAKRASLAGFRVTLSYIAIELDECIQRVASRVQLGGHGVTAAVLADTYAASMRNLPRALAGFSVVQIHDNSAPGPAKPVLVLEAHDGAVVTVHASPPRWLRAALEGTPYALSTGPDTRP